jgi:hypothetical protein
MTIFETWCLVAMAVLALEHDGGNNSRAFALLSVPFWIVEWVR